MYLDDVIRRFRTSVEIRSLAPQAVLDARYIVWLEVFLLRWAVWTDVKASYTNDV